MLFKEIALCCSKYLCRPSLSLIRGFNCTLSCSQFLICRTYVKVYNTHLYCKSNSKLCSCIKCNFRIHSKYQSQYYHTNNQKFRNRTVQLYIIAGIVLVAGLSYAAVPLYRIYCQATGKGGQATVIEKSNKIEGMPKIKDRVITVRFNADTVSSLQWNFKPQQNYIKIVPGETALAFYTARNPMSAPIIGIATYNVLPFEAGQYFNKIQCFCFEEQRLDPNEEVDMPVFFYIDPEFVEDPKMENVNEITLSYTFFEAKEGLQLPLPTFK